MIAADAVLKQLEEVCALPNQKKNGKNKGVCSNLSIITEMPLFMRFTGWRADYCKRLEDREIGIAT
jgi:hypothetical protein